MKAFANGQDEYSTFGSTPPGTGVKAQRTQRRLYRFGRNEAVLVYVLDLADFSNTALARRGCIPRHLPFTSHLVVNDRHPSQGLDLLHRMRGGPVLGQMLLPQTRYFLSEEHAEFVRGGFEEGSQAFDPTPVRTVAHRMVAMLARAAGGMGKLRALVRSQDTCIKFVIITYVHNFVWQVLMPQASMPAEASFEINSKELSV